MALPKDSYLIIGGCGFVGRHIVEQLLSRGEPSVAVFDLVQRHFDPEVMFFTGDLCDEQLLLDVIEKCQATCIIHTASPMHGTSNQALYWRVNVDGTKAVIAACLHSNRVKKLVYTSSAGVVYTSAEEQINVDERLPYVTETTAYDTYNLTKAIAEQLVLDANGKEGLRTIALRPSGIFGPGDRQNFPSLADVIRRGQTRFLIGANTNLFDWTYVGNVAKAHLLAADKLSQSYINSIISKSREEICDSPLPPISITTGEIPIPTSLARPLGPTLTPVPNAAAIEAAYNSQFDHKTKDESKEDKDNINEPRAILRTKYDALTETNISKELSNPLRPDGQAFFITNGEPMAFWDYIHAAWFALGHTPPTPIVLHKTIGLVLASAAEWFSWLTGRKPGFTKERVGYATTNRWFNIEKARRVLGYEPDVGMEEGIRITAKWYLDSLGVDAIKRE